MTEIKVPVQSP